MCARARVCVSVILHCFAFTTLPQNNRSSHENFINFNSHNKIFLLINENSNNMFNSELNKICSTHICHMSTTAQKICSKK